MNELGWTPAHNFEDGIELTINWYVENKNWWKKVMSGEYKNYFEQNYGSKMS